MIAKTPQPPYYAVIFTSVLSLNKEGYARMADKMIELAEKQPGFLGWESVRDELGITVSYWESEEAIKNWKTNVDHLEAQDRGKKQWYEMYKIRVAKVERESGFEGLFD